MGFRKDQLWKVPVFCIGAGVVTDIVWLAAELLVRLVSYPGYGHVDYLLLYGVCFLAALLLGGLYFFRDMTRRELLVSVSISVLYGAALYAVEWVDELRLAASGAPWPSSWGCFPDWSWMLFAPFRWLDFVHFIDPVSAGQARALTLLLPYLFVPFGSGEKKSC